MLRWLVILSVAFTSCHTEEAPKLPTTEELAPKNIPPPKVLTPKEIADRLPLPPCVGSVGSGEPGPAQEIPFGKVIWALAGSTLSLKLAPPTQELRIGVLAGIRDQSAEEPTDLKPALAFFVARKAELIVVAGNLGESPERLAQNLQVLVETGLLVLAIPGNRDDFRAYVNAMRELRKTHRNLIDMTKVRRVHTALVDVLSLPGFSDRSYMPKEGCMYGEADVSALTVLAAQNTLPTLLLAYAAPQQQGAQALDRTAEGGNAGDARLAGVMGPIPFGVFPQVADAGGAATDRLGKRVLENAWSSELWLNPGSVGNRPWTLNSGGQSHGLCGVITLRRSPKAGVQAKYELFRMPEHP